MAAFIFALIIVALLASPSAGASYVRGHNPAAGITTASAPNLLFWDPRDVARVRQSVRQGDPRFKPAVDKLKRDAEAALKLGPFSVMDKTTVPPSGDKHDYMSMAIYYWPNPATATGKPYVNRDGEVNPESNTGAYDKASFDRMTSSSFTLAAAYYFTGDARYSDKAADLLRRWFISPATRMNPNLQYGQGVPGADFGRPSGIIETVAMLNTVDAAALLVGSRAWKGEDQKALQGWMRDYADWLRRSKLGQSESAARNNHGAWYDAQVSAFSLFAGNRDAAAMTLQWKTPRRIASQIEPDGRQPLELARTKSLSYSLYNLEAFISNAILGERLGIDLWYYSAPGGGSIRKAIDYLVPYLDGSKPWPYRQIAAERGVGFAPYLRRAAVRYRDESYAALADRLLGNAASTDRLNLLCPYQPPYR